MSGRALHLLAGAVLLLAIVLPLPPAALADGCFFKERRFAAPSPIPAQRALIIHRDGVERLVVESTVDPEGQTFGWILPLPAKPTSVEVATPGVLDTLDLATRPAVRSGGSWSEVYFPAWLLVILLTALRLYFARRRGTPTLLGRFETVIVFLLVFSISFVLIIPNLLAGKLGMPAVTVPGVTSSDPQRVGSYEVTVLEAKDGAALGKWLEGNGLAAVPAAGRPIVDDYIARGWVFVAARLAREGTGPAAPHPLSVVFPAAKPIYPMRLTALAGGTTDLRIHVVAAGSATCAPLEARFSQPFREDDIEYGPYREESGRAFLFGSTWDQRQLAHPFLLAHLWPDCIVTRLEGSMAAAAMDRDLVFDVGEVSPRIHALYTEGEAWQAGALRVLWIWALALLVLVLLPDRWLPRLGAPGSPFLRWLVVVTVLAGVGVAGVRASLPTIPESGVVRASDPFRWGNPARRLLMESDAYAGKPLAEVRALLEGKFREFKLRNPYTGRPLAWSDSPGDVQLFEDHRGPVLRIVSLGGAPLDRPWFTERWHGLLFMAPGPKGTAAQAREWLFPAGVANLLNPFTGAPVREGRSPGDAEVLDEDGTVVVRAWFREGKHQDFPLR